MIRTLTEEQTKYNLLLEEIIGNIDILMQFHNSIIDKVKSLDFVLHTEKQPEGVKFGIEIVEKAFLIKNNAYIESLNGQDVALKMFSKKIKPLKNYGVIISKFNNITILHFYIPYDKNNINEVRKFIDKNQETISFIMNYYNLDTIDINWDSNGFEFDCELYKVHPFNITSKKTLF